MAKKKKEKLVAFEILSPDTIHPHTDRVCRNFVCYESDLRKRLDDEVRREDFRNNQKIQKDFDTICGYQTEAREGLGNLYLDMVSVTPANLEKSVKTTTPYIYRTRYYGESKTPDIYGTKSDAIAQIQKRVKTRRALMHYNGVTERADFNIDHIESLLGTLEEDTVEFDISPICRGELEGDMLLVTIFKNDMKV